jgi:taurine transport system permease protein
MTRHQEIMASIGPEVAARYTDRMPMGESAQAPPPSKPKPAHRAHPRPTRTSRDFRLLSLGTIAVALMAWWLATEWRLVKPLFLPPPAAIVESFLRVTGEGFADATLVEHLTASLARLFAALALTLTVGVPLGILAGISRSARAVVDPVVEFVRPIPPLAYLPLIIIWCGIGEASKVLVLWLAMFPAVLLSTIVGVRSVAPERIEAARVLGATRLQVARFVVLPSALPSILTGVRIGLGSGWSTLVAAELIAATRGLGFMIESAAQFLVTDVVVMGILIIAAVAFSLEGVVRLAERIFVPWHGRG